MFKAEVIIRDFGWKRFLGFIELMKNRSYVKVGVFGPNAEKIHGDDGITIADLAAIHEYGTRDGHIPERSFLRSTFEANRPQYVEVLQKLLIAIIDQKMSVKQALGLLGTKMVSDVKKRVTEGTGVPPPLAESTVKRKGSARALVDTGRMLGAVIYEVVMKG